MRVGRGAARSRLTALAAALLATGAIAAPGAAAHVQGSFARTGDMTVPRADAASAPLGDGRVLVAGGWDPTDLNFDTVLNSAEIFDPATDTFSPTGSMTTPRFDAAAAPLPDGRVLVVGGSHATHPTQPLKSAEIFDPATGTFSPTGDMAIIRGTPAAAPLSDGRVLVAGGDSSNSNAASAEIFDPRTGTFSPTGEMTVPRFGAAAAPLPNGRVLVLGGVFPPTSLPEIFDLAAGKFAPAGHKAFTGGSDAAAQLPDGRALIVFGSGNFGVGEIFDPVTDNFVSTDHMNTRRYGATAAPLPDGRVLVAGSVVGFGPEALALTRSAELFTPSFFYRLDGRRLQVSVASAGTLTATEAKAGPAASAAGKSRRLKSGRRVGGPGVISFKLRAVGNARRKLARRGRVRVLARLRFVPKAVKGNCVTEVSPCFTSSYSITQTVRLTLKAKRRR